jgi:hypothetical protein
MAQFPWGNLNGLWHPTWLSPGPRECRFAFLCVEIVGFVFSERRQVFAGGISLPVGAPHRTNP